MMPVRAAAVPANVMNAMAEAASSAEDRESILEVFMKGEGGEQ